MLENCHSVKKANPENISIKGTHTTPPKKKTASYYETYLSACCFIFAQHCVLAC